MTSSTVVSERLSSSHARVDSPTTMEQPRCHLPIVRKRRRHASRLYLICTLIPGHSYLNSFYVNKNGSYTNYTLPREQHVNQRFTSSPATSYYLDIHHAAGGRTNSPHSPQLNVRLSASSHSACTVRLRDALRLLPRLWDTYITS